MSTTRSSAAAARLLTTLLALLLAETLLVAPRRSATAVLRSAGDAVVAAAPSPPLAAAASAAPLPGGTVAVAVVEQQHRVGTTSSRAPRASSLRTPGVSGPETERPFLTASLVKLFLAEGVLHRARTGDIVLDDWDRVRLREMLRSSDDAVASSSWVRFGGARVVTDVAARYGLTGTAPPAVPGQWGQAVTTARDVAVFLARLPVLAHPEDAFALLWWMTEATPLAADGYDQRFGLLTLPGPTAAKQGWMCCVAGTRQLHSVGVRDGRVVVLLSEAPAAAGEAAVRARLDAVAAAVPFPADRC